MAYNHVDLQDVEPFRGVFYKMRRALGVEGFGINYIEVPPDAEGMEHDELQTGHEEVYVILDGSDPMRWRSRRGAGSGSTPRSAARSSGARRA